MRAVPWSTVQWQVSVYGRLVSISKCESLGGTGNHFTNDIDNWLQGCSYSSALAMELLQSYTKPSIFPLQSNWMEHSVCVHPNSNKVTGTNSVFGTTGQSMLSGHMQRYLAIWEKHWIQKSKTSISLNLNCEWDLVCEMGRGVKITAFLYICAFCSLT